jgi:multiple sugar transport system substrate-binding protein
MKKLKVLLPIILIFALLLPGCNATTKPVVNLRVGVDSSMSPPIITVLSDEVKTWNAVNPDIQVTLEVTPEYWTKIPSAFAAGTGPDIIYNTVTETTSTFGQLGMYLSLDDYIKNSKVIKPSDFVKGIWDTAVWNGHTWVIPYNWSDIGVVYNKAMFDAAGVAYPKPGWTRDEFLADAKALTKAPNQFGFYDDSWPYLGVFPFILTAGGEIHTADKSKVIAGTDVPGLEAVTFYVDLVRTEKVAPTATELGQNTNPFATSLVAMQVVRSWTPSTFKDIAPDLKYGVTSIPMVSKRINYFEGAGFGINSKSQHPDEAWKFIEFLSSEAQQKAMGDLQIYFPARQSTIDEIQWDDNMKAFLDESQYGLDLQQVSQYETLTSEWSYWLATAVGGVDPINIPNDIATVNAKLNKALDAYPVK